MPRISCHDHQSTATELGTSGSSSSICRTAAVHAKPERRRSAMLMRLHVESRRGSISRREVRCRRRRCHCLAPAALALPPRPALPPANAGCTIPPCTTFSRLSMACPCQFAGADAVPNLLVHPPLLRKAIGLEGVPPLAPVHRLRCRLRRLDVASITKRLALGSFR